MKKEIVIKSIITILIPIVIVFLQVLIIGVSLKDLGITFAAISLGQIFPFLIFENLLYSKVFKLQEKISYPQNNAIQLNYEVISDESKNLSQIRLIAIGIFILNLVLFVSVLLLNLQEKTLMQIIIGFISCIITWWFLIKK